MKEIIDILFFIFTGICIGFGTGYILGMIITDKQWAKKENRCIYFIPYEGFDGTDDYIDLPLLYCIVQIQKYLMRFYKCSDVEVFDRALTQKEIYDKFKNEG